MTNAIIEKAKERFAHTHESLAREFGAIRAGRANASLLDRITVEYYGAPTPLNQLASITVPEARVLLISPFDKGSIADIERAINESDLGINPANDGSVIRLVIPALTEETRKELAKEVKKVGKSVRVYVTGSDLLNGTPILDIKPYIQYSDAVVDAKSGYAQHEPERMMVIWSESAEQQKQELIQAQSLDDRIVSELEQVLSLDPRPAYQNDARRT